MSDTTLADRVRVRHIVEDVLALLTVDTALFGLFSGGCIAALWLLVTRSKSGPRTQLPGRITSAVILFLMYVMAFSYLGLEASSTVSGFVDGTGDLGILEDNLTQPLSTREDEKAVFLFMQIILANGFMTYRLCEVWHRNLFVVVLPALLTLATFGAGVAMLVKLTHLSTAYPADVRTTLYFAFNSATIGLCAVLIIAGRLVYKPRFYDSPLLPRAAVVIIDLVIQSAVVYVAASIGLAVFMSEDLSKPRPKWISSGIPSFTGVTISAIILWELLMVKTEEESDDREKLNVQHVSEVA